jgi:NADPH-dependent F420 reductase
MGGTGPEGRGLATRLGLAGIPAFVGSREIDRAREAVAKIRTAGVTIIEAASNDEVADRCDLVFLAVPFARAAEVVDAYRDRFRTRAVVVDLTVPLAFVDGVPRFVEMPEGSAAEHLRARLPATVRLAAALKTIPASVLGRVEVALDCDEFVCGDSPQARAAVIDTLGRIPGLRLLDVGGLEASRSLERMTLLAVEINKRYKIRTARFRVVGL